MMFALIDIKHLATIFGFTNIKHFTGTDGTASMRVILITNRFHFYHVFTTD